ncbi:MAG: cohesin domain-containing protein [Bryobacteraceae bacterium]|jgi:general secretion pathway protein D
MRFFNRLTAVWLAAAMIAPLAPLEAKTRKGDKFLAEGRIAEGKKDWDTALAAYEKALSEDPGEMNYQMPAEKARFQCAQMHVDAGLRLRGQGQLDESLAEFQKAYGINPGSAVAAQEVDLTRQMIERERKRQSTTGREAAPAERALTPVEQYHKEEKEQLDRLQGVPELKPLNPQPITLKINNKTRVLFDTVAKYASINLLWDPEYQPPAKDGFNVELNDSTIEQALDYLAVLTHSFWKPLSPNTIFVTNENPNKRRDYEEQVVKVFYLQNIQSTQELQEVVTALRTVADLQKVFAYNGQNAIIARGEADRVELAEKIINDLDKPKAEVVVDLMVIEASTTFSKQVTAAIASTGLNLPVSFNPRSSIQVASSTTSTNNTTGTGATTPTTGTGATSGSTGTLIPLNELSHIGNSDFATTLPSALLQAALSDAGSKILQAPQLRSVDNVKATLKIGTKEPIASGSFQPGVAGVGVNPLVNTQFTYQDVGVNVEITPRVHENGDVTMHIDLDISTIVGYANLGGVSQPIIGQRKVQHDIRMKEGEVGLLGGLINTEDDKTVTGIPGLASIPLLGNLFKGSSVNHNRDELMIVVIPHVIRQPEITAQNLRTIAVGTTSITHLNRAPRPPEATPTVPSVADMQPPPPPGPGSPATVPAVNPMPVPPATAPPFAPGAEPPPTGPARTSDFNGPTRVYFKPGHVEAAAGANFTVDVALENGTDVATAPMIFEFDPKLLHLNDITLGGLLSSGAEKPVFTKNIQNERGAASVILNVTPDKPGVTAAAGTLVTLNFQAVAAGGGTVTIQSLAVKNSRGSVIHTGSPQLTVTVK